MSEWFETLDGIQSHVWGVLGAGLSLRDAPARQPTFATVSPDGWPEARTVVLRGVDPVARVLTVHTDLYSSKVASLKAHPRAALHVWVPEDDLQIRVQADVTIAHGAEVRAEWDKVPDPSRQSYGVTPPPGTVIAGALDYVKSPDPETFAVVSCEVVTMDAVHLGDVHRRAAFTQVGEWRGQWLAP